MVNVLSRRLPAFSTLPPDDFAALDAITSRSQREVSPRRDVVREGEEARSIYLILEGWACRYKTLPDGRRQIVGFCVPGDVSDADAFLLRHMDHGICAITRLRLAEIEQDDYRALLVGRPHLARALRHNNVVTASIQREWALSLGQRTASERIAHLLCEAYLRLEAAGLAQGGACDFPLTQVDLADATGLTPVHVNRTLQELRRMRLIELTNKRLTIPDLAALKRAALFNDTYLHKAVVSGAAL